MPSGIYEHTPSWAASEDAIVRERWGGKQSAREIADMLPDRTRNAVIGRAHRLGLGRKGAQREPTMRCPPKPKRQRIPKHILKRVRPPMEKPPPIPSLSIPFLDTKFGQCKAITDATRYAQKCCGHTTDAGGVYCKWHSALHYTPATQRRGRLM